MSLISVAELCELIVAGGGAEHRDVVVCDVRFHLDDHDRGRREYDLAHLPLAQFVDLHTELAGGHGGGRHPLPPVPDFAALLGRLGVRPGSTVVAYDDAGGATASRLWWMLRSIGHGRAAVLDGGIQAWTAAGLELTSDVVPVTPTSYPAAPDWTGIVDAEAVAQSAALGGTVIDARAPERFRGETEPIDPRAGHIPGAINRFHGDTVGPDGLHVSTERLAELFVGVGEHPIVYCGSGVTACHTLLAMSTIGVTGARLYPGSWSEWSGVPERAVATSA